MFHQKRSAFSLLDVETTASRKIKATLCALFTPDDKIPRFESPIGYGDIHGNQLGKNHNKHLVCCFFTLAAHYKRGV